MSPCSGGGNEEDENEDDIHGSEVDDEDEYDIDEQSDEDEEEEEEEDEEEVCTIDRWTVAAYTWAYVPLARNTGSAVSREGTTYPLSISGHNLTMGLCAEFFFAFRFAYDGAVGGVRGGRILDLAGETSKVVLEELLADELDDERNDCDEGDEGDEPNKREHDNDEDDALHNPNV